MVKELEIDAYRKGSELFVVLRGQLVMNHSQDTKTRLLNLLTPQADRMYLYLAELNLLDSAGLGVLVGMKMAANKSRSRLVLLSPTARIEDIFRVSKLDTIFEILTGAEAEVILASFKKDEFCIWRDSKDLSQGQLHTEVHEDPVPGSTLGQLTNVESLDEESSRQVRQCCMDAMEYLRQGDYHRTIEAYLQALRIDPANLSALNNLGIIYEKQPEWYPQAQATWSKVLEISTRQQDQKHATRANRHLESLAKLTRVK